MAKRLTQHAAHCACSECVNRRLNGQDIKQHPPSEGLDRLQMSVLDAPTLQISGAEIPLAEIEDDDNGESACVITVGGEEADWERRAREWHESGGETP